MTKQHSLFENVYEVTKLIPKGRVTSYGLIAKYLGAKMSARMVGWAMNAAHDMPEIPTHRVVNKIGLLTGKGYFDNPNTMQQRLEMEGLTIENDQIINFEKLVWNPSEALEL